MHISMNGGDFNPRDSGKLFRYMYSVCAANTCDKCAFGNGEWVQTDGDSMIRCETALWKQYFKSGDKNE